MVVYRLERSLNGAKHRITTTYSLHMLTISFTITTYCSHDGTQNKFMTSCYCYIVMLYTHVLTVVYIFKQLTY